MSSRSTAIEGLLECEYFDIRSNNVADVFRIFVAKPPSLPAGRRAPAIYVADGNGGFEIVLGIQRMLAWGGEAPPAYVVGLGYPTEDGYQRAIEKRNRDYTPSDGGEHGAILGVDVAPGASAFLRFLVEELKPQLATRYAIDEQDATFFGASLGGLFGAWSLLNAPTTFQRYILASPFISWNNEEIWKWEHAFAAANVDLSARVFVAAGEFETAEHGRRSALHVAKSNPLLRAQVENMIARFDAHGWPRTAEIALEFCSKLQARAYCSARVYGCNFPGETHISVSPAVISRGLRYVFDQWQP